MEHIEIEKDGGTKKKKRLTKKDEQTIADYVCQTLEDRKNRRIDLEKNWKEVDRQVAMTPDLRHKMDRNGNIPKEKQWLPEMELPLQAQALEMLTADTRRMLFPDNNSWFIAHGEVNQEFLRKAERFPIIQDSEYEAVTGSGGEQQKLNQSDVDLVVQTYTDWIHRQFDFRGNVDAINAQSFQYGSGVGRARSVKSSVFIETKRGMARKDMLIPVLFPVDIKNTYLEDRSFHLMNEGLNFSPATVQCKKMNVQDIMLAAKKGSTNPRDMNGGWLTKNLSGLEGDKDGCVEVVELEGDIVVPRRTTESLYIPNAIVTVAKGGKGSSEHTPVIRIRFRETSFSSYIAFPYHRECLSSPYATSPLLKGRPIQAGASDALNRLMISAALSSQPVVRYDRDDATLTASGGVPIFPGSQFASTGDVDVLDIGNPGEMLNIYTALLNQYAEVTGITAGRLGGQTVSHTTAFAKDAEITRGTIRTVDYVAATLHGPLTQWLNLAYEMGRKNLGGKTVSAFSPKAKQFINIGQDVLPETVFFEAIGSAAPQEMQQRGALMVQGVQAMLNLETFKLSTGGGTPMNIEALQRKLAEQFGVTELDEVFIEPSQGPVVGAPGQPGIPGDSQAGIAGNALPAAIQNFPEGQL